MQGRKVVVIGAGMVGLSVAWQALQRGAEVVVVERETPAAGSSWGNAGWISPALAVPLAEPSVVQFGIRSLFDPNSPLYLAPRADPTLVRFGLRFLLDCTMDKWRRTMASYVPLNRRAFAAFDALGEHLAGDDRAATPTAPIWAAFRTEEDMAGLRREIELINQAGLTLETEEVGADVLHQHLPFLTDEVAAGIRIDGQRHLNGGDYVDALADAFVAAGGELRTGAVRDVRRSAGPVVCELAGGATIESDDVVIANGAWMPKLMKRHGVHVPLVAGRGYSFRVDVPNWEEPQCFYLPVQRVACTPVDGRLRIAGTMEFRPVDAPLDKNRIDAIINSIDPLIEGIDFEARTDEWVGGRPVTADSLPLVGATKTPGVWIAGGHGMWGITLGPLTGELLVEQMATGRPDPMLVPLNPLR